MIELTISLIIGSLLLLVFLYFDYHYIDSDDSEPFEEELEMAYEDAKKGISTTIDYSNGYWTVEKKQTDNEEN